MLTLLKSELDKYGAFSGTIPPALAAMSKAIPNMRIPTRMKLAFAVSELILFASQFRRNIQHWNGSKIPINAITFILAESGVGKDSSVNALRKCFHTAYEQIAVKRKEIAKAQARQAAIEDGAEDVNSWEGIRHYYNEPGDLFVAPGTVEGFIAHLNELDEAGIGAGYLYTGEIGAQLMTSSTIIQNIEFLAEIYDEGKREAKIIRSKENQTKSIKNLPVSALFGGSQDNILFEADVKKKFRTEFTTKLARRSFFYYNNNETIPMPIYKTAKEILDAEKKVEDDSILIRQQLDITFSQITNYQLTKVSCPITVEPIVRDIFLLYKRYNEEAAIQIKHQYPISRIVRQHLQWKALKLAGALAIVNNHESVTKDDYIAAISFVELLDQDMVNFEIDLNKEPYELFVIYMQQVMEDNKAFANLHTLKKLGYISGTSNAQNKLKELIKFASSVDTAGVYKIVDKGIEYTRIVKTDTIGCSYLPLTGSKDNRAKNCATGYTFAQATFPELVNILREDYAYSPFNFKGGVRGKDNIISGCKWICFDIDKSNVTDEECHAILHNFNHHIVRTSDPDNGFKFRVILELDSEVDIEDKVWKYFMASIAEYLSLTADPLPKSQIFFSYADRVIHSVTTANPIEVREHILFANSQSEQRTPAITLSTPQKKAQLADPLVTFEYAFEAEPGGRSLSLIRAAKHAKDLGSTNEDIIALMHAINDYWQFPLDNSELQRTILNQISRW